MQVHLVDGTYELFRHYFAIPGQTNQEGLQVAATRGVANSMLSLLRDGATHVAIATDHVIQSFRNDLWAGYKSGEGIEPDLLTQFPLLEDSLEALGFVVWKMVKEEADDGMAAGAAMAARDERVREVVICTPDKDLAQCVVGDRVVQYDRRKGVRSNADGVREKFGVSPESIPDYLALVGDSADGFPGLRGWGAKSTSTVLAHFEHLENIPDSEAEWPFKVRGAAKLAATLAADRELALLFRHIATVDLEAPVSASVDELEWLGPRPELADIAKKASGSRTRATGGRTLARPGGFVCRRRAAVLGHQAPRI